MNWLQLIQLILASEEAELPIISAIIAAAHGASPTHLAMVNEAIGAALATKSKP